MGSQVDVATFNLRRPRTLLQSLGGASVYQRNANFHATLESFRKTVDHVPELPQTFETDPQDNHGNHTRQVLSRGRFITKRKLKKQLRECQESLGSCLARESQAASLIPFLFVQMAESCSIEMDQGRYFLRTQDMDVDTYAFSDRPYRYAQTYSTSFFTDYLFRELFSSVPPNAAVTFNVFDGQSEASFEGPLVSVFLNASFMTFQSDNSTLIEYEIIQSPEQEAILSLSNFFSGVNTTQNASRLFEHCSLFIDAGEREADRAFLKPKNTLVNAANKLDNKVANVVQAGPPKLQQSKLQKYAKVWQINGKGGVDSKDYIKGAADTIRATASFIEQCKTQCDAKTITSGVSGLFLASAFVVGAAFPPLGIAMLIVGSIGSLVSALFLDSASVSKLDTTISPAMIQAAVDRALTSFTVNVDINMLDAFRTFYDIDINNYVNFLGQLGYILGTPDSQSDADKQIQYWYDQQYFPAWTGTYQPAIVKMEAQYNTWFGSNPSGIRTKLKNWKTGCDSDTCKPNNADFYRDGVNRLKSCKESKDNAQTNWRELGQFANAYMATAVKMMMFASQVINILQTYSFCDPDIYDQDTINRSCKWNRAMEDLLSKVFQINTRSLYLQTVMEEISTACNPDGRGWPFTQYCEGVSGKCNYKYGIAISNTQYGDRFDSTNEEGKFVELDKSFKKSNSELACQNIYDRWNGPYDFGFGGLYGYASGGSVQQGNCGEITDKANQGGYIILGATPTFCMNDDFPRCTELYTIDDLWGVDV